jgi:PAS domain S-box-containing protein
MTHDDYLAILNASPTPMVVGQDGRVAYATPSTALLTGRSLDDIIGSTYLSLIHPDDRAMVAERGRTRLLNAAPPGPYAFRLLRPDGSVRIVEMEPVRISWQGRPAVASAIIDVTERREREERLSVLAKLLDTAAASITVHDFQGAFKYANERTFQLHGYTRDEFMAMNLRDLDDPESARLIEPRIRELIDKGEASFEVRHRRKDGGTIPFLVCARVGEWHGEKVALSICYDLSEQKRQEAERARLEAQVQQSQRLESLGILAGGLAHDFNNLLSGIFGYIDLALAAERRGHDGSEFLEKALSVFERAKGLTHQLLTFSKGGAPIRRPGRLEPILRECIAFALSGSSIVRELNMEPGLRVCDFDPVQISQVIDNIVINAVQAMPSGGRLKVTARNVSLAEGQEPSLPAGDYVRIDIADSGMGIPADQLPRIFDPFFTTKEHGSGLGLATSYSIMRKHEGLLSARSEPGKGSIFSILLPASESGTVEGETEELRRAGTGKVLIMDDEDYVLDILSEMLREAGYEPLTAREGRAALEACRAAAAAGEAPVCAILDLTVPGGAGGKEIIRELRAEFPNMPVLATSGYSDDPVMARPAEHGFSGSLGKPYRQGELAEVLKACLGGGEPQ